MELTNDSLPFITGMGYRKMCNYIFDEFNTFDIETIDKFDGMKIFVKTDMIKYFNQYIIPKINNYFILYTHNSDMCIDDSYLPILENNYLINWYAQNVNTIHSKLKSIPIGIANSRWGHGNTNILKKVISNLNKKSNLVYCNIDINTNILERTKCLESIYPIINSNRVDFETYLNEMAKSYFVISPNGNGIDCHKTWESLYLKSIPIVTRSINISHYENLPILILDDWSDIENIELNEDLYNKIMLKYENFSNDFIFT